MRILSYPSCACDHSYCFSWLRYKLLHTYDDALYGGWISSLITAEGSETASDEGVVTADDAEFDDGNLEWREDEECMQTFLEGNFSVST